MVKDGIFNMTHVIAITNQKGGVGKTTTCINLAGALIEMGCKVSVADMNNEQRSAFKWANRGDSLKSIVTIISDKTPLFDINLLKESSDFILVDTAPELMTPALKAALLANLIIIPCTPSPLDLESSEDTINLIEEAEKPYILLASCVRSGTTLGAQLREILVKIGNTFDTVIHQRVDIVEAAIVGQWVGEYRKNSKAHREYQQLAQELINRLGLEK